MTMSDATSGRAAYETWRAAVPEIVCNVPAGRWEDLPETVRAGFDAIAVEEPHAAAGTWTTAECLERISDLAGALHEIKQAYAPGTIAHDLARATLDQNGPKPQPATERFATEALVRFAGSGQWLTTTDDGRLDMRAELLAVKRAVREVLDAAATPAQPAPEPAAAALALVLMILRDGTQSHASMVRRAVAAIERAGATT